MDEIEKLRQDTSPGSRTESGNSTPDAFSEAVEQALVDINRGEKSKNLSVRDEHVAAVLYALEEVGGEKEIGEALQQLANRNERDVDRSEILRSALRIGLEEVAPELMADARETHGEFVRDGL